MRIYLLGLFLAAFPQVSLANFLQSIPLNNEGVQLLKDESHFQAYQKFVEALSHEPLSPWIHINLGLSFLRNEEPEKALGEFETASILAQDNPEAQFMALFNIAKLKTDKKDIPGALQAYQKALEVNKDSIEVKTNIELLWQGGGEGKGDQEQKQDQEGEGENKQPQDGDQENQDPKQDQGQQPQENKKNQPIPFDSKELTPENVRKILEELKNQEQAIRANEQRKGMKESPRDKDW